MSLPNLFHFAPSELSQDAVFAWLLAWADVSLAAANPPLHTAGRRLLAELVEATGEKAPETAVPVRVRRQVDHVDILVEVGPELVLAIEDKVHTGEHSDQLATYRTAIAKRYPGRRSALVYLRTGEQASLDGVKQAGWTPVGRDRLLAALRPGRGASDVLDQFLDHVEGLDADVRSFEALLPVGWNDVRPDVRQRLLWAGLFQRLGPLLGGRWDYVPNQNGGFMGFWWSFVKVAGGEVYLQLEHDRLVAKVDSGKDGDRRKLRDTWTRRVTRLDGPVRFQRPDRLGHGRWMTVGVAENGYLRPKAEGGLDLDATFAVLDAATTALRELVAAHPEG